MSVTVESGTVLQLERFWRWLKGHPNCIVRAGSQDCAFHDQADLHWHLEDGPEHALSVQLIWGKQTLGEMVIIPGDVLFVQAAPDTEGEEPGRFLFELVGGPRDEAYPLYHFLMAHGFDEATTPHGPLKH